MDAASGGAVARHYGSADVIARIREVLAGAGIDPATLTRRDLSPFDEFHGGGLASTRDLATYAGVDAGTSVVDIGCGIGGPARTLADEFGATVTGVDLTPAFVAAASWLTERVGMTAACRFVEGSATALPLPDACCDMAWSQNMMMNIADKPAFFSEVARVVRPGGRFAFEAVLSGNGEALHFPTFWASHAGLNHLCTRAELESMLEAAGLTLEKLDDTTAAVIANGRKRQAAATDPRALSIGVIVPEAVTEKMANALRNNEEGCTIAVKGVAVRDYHGR